jgi:hypothetical protein
MSKDQRQPPTQQSSGFGFKSRFSLSSLLPARHPPLVISHPAPALPTRTVHHTRPVLRVSDRIESSYGLTDDPFDSYAGADADGYAPRKGDSKRRESGISVNGGRLATPPKSTTPKKRPPPLNLARTRAAFPTVKGVTLVRDPITPSPNSSSSPSPPSSAGDIKFVNSIPKRNESLPVVRGTSDIKKAASKAGRMFKTSEKKQQRALPPLAVDSPCDDFVTIEPEHKYPSWKGGKVDIRPGEHIPPNLIRQTKEQEDNRKPTGGYLAKPTLSRQASSIYSPSEDQYESVLHNVLLTPTYNAPSTAHKSTTDLMGRAEKRQTLMDRASGWGKSVLKTVPAVGVNVIQYGRQVRGGVNRLEEKEMTRFPPLRVQRSASNTAGAGVNPTPPRPKGNRERAISTSSSISTPGSAIRGVQGTPYRRSPAWTSGRDREESVGFEREDKRDHDQQGGGKRPLVGVNVSWQAGDGEGKRSISVSEAWRVKKDKEQALKRKKLLWRVSPFSPLGLG